MELLYPQSRSTHTSAASAERERTKDDAFFMQQLFMDRWKKSGDYFNLKWTSDPVVVPPSEWSLLVNASRCVRECAGVGVGVGVDMGVGVGVCVYAYVHLCVCISVYCMYVYVCMYVSEFVCVCARRCMHACAEVRERL